MIRVLCALGLAAVLMAGCAGVATEPQIRTVPVEVKVKEPCLTPPTHPVYQYGKGQKPESSAVQAQILASDFEKAEQYGIAWEVAATGCLISGGAGPAVAQPASDSLRK